MDRERERFYEWAYGDLLSNTIRPLIAEWLVAKALDQINRYREEWASYDIKLDSTCIEVKSAAYLQSWHNGTSKPSTISFDIAQRGWAWDPASLKNIPLQQRAADIYIFCVFETKVREIADPLDPSQWTFYVLARCILDRHFGRQKSVRLSRLIPLTSPIRYFELANAVRVAASP